MNLTFPRLDWLFAWNAGLLEWPPFEVLLVSSTCYRAPCALLAGGLRLIALQTFVFAGNAACWELSVCVCNPLSPRRF
jgi:hypothetical protein